MFIALISERSFDTIPNLDVAILQLEISIKLNSPQLIALSSQCEKVQLVTSEILPEKSIASFPIRLNVELIILPSE